jgi:hypothetical protein
MNKIKCLIAIAITLTFLMVVVANPVSAGGALANGSCSTFNGTTFMTGYWNEKVASGCTLYYQFEAYKDITTGTPETIWEANAYLTPESNGNHVIEDTDHCCIIKIYNPISAGSSSIFLKFSPNAGANYGNSHDICYQIGASISGIVVPGTSVGANVGVTYATTYWDTAVGIKSMTSTVYQVNADIDQQKDEARYFVAGCCANRISSGLQTATLYVEGDFEAQGYFGGTNTVIKDTKTLHCYI